MIILVRHGEATHHTEHLTGGWTDSELTAAGCAQIEIVAAKLALEDSSFSLCNRNDVDVGVKVTCLWRETTPRTSSNGMSSKSVPAFDALRMSSLLNVEFVA